MVCKANIWGNRLALTDSQGLQGTEAGDQAGVQARALRQGTYHNDNYKRAATDRLQAVEHYKELLTYVKSAVTRNYSEKSINNMLDFIEKAAEDADAYRCMEQFYALTLDIFQSTNNERLWLKTNIKLARLWLDRKDYRQLTEKLRELHKACQSEDGTDDPSKGTYSLEVYSLEILMYAETRNNKRLKVRLVSSKSNPMCIIADATTGTIPTRAQGQVGGSASQDHGYHPRMWWQDAHERRSVLQRAETPSNANLSQRTGRGRRATSSRVSKTTMRRVPCSGSRS
jgi:hypothetical protein